MFHLSFLHNKIWDGKNRQKTTNVTTMDFEWDAAKAASNKIKHGVSFNFAVRVFLDPCRIETYDDREDYGEERWATIGYADPTMLYVVYTIRNNDTIRLISARKANEREQRQYRQIHA